MPLFIQMDWFIPEETYLVICGSFCECRISQISPAHNYVQASSHSCITTVYLAIALFHLALTLLEPAPSYQILSTALVDTLTPNLLLFSSLELSAQWSIFLQSLNFLPNIFPASLPFYSNNLNFFKVISLEIIIFFSWNSSPFPFVYSSNLKCDYLPITFCLIVGFYFFLTIHRANWATPWYPA